MITTKPVQTVRWSQ